MKEVFTVGRGGYPHIPAPHIYIRANYNSALKKKGVRISFNYCTSILNDASAVDYIIIGNRIYFDFGSEYRLERTFHVNRTGIIADDKLLEFCSSDYYIPMFDNGSGYWYIEEHEE